MKCCTVGTFSLFTATCGTPGVIDALLSAHRLLFPSQCNDEVFTDKAIELLEMASKLMVTASSSLGGRRRAQSLDVTEVTGGATQGDKHAEAPKTSQACLFGVARTFPLPCYRT